MYVEKAIIAEAKLGEPERSKRETWRVRKDGEVRH